MAENYSQFATFKLVPVSHKGPSGSQTMYSFDHMTINNQSGPATQYVMVVSQSPNSFSNGGQYKVQGGVNQSGNITPQQQYVEISASGQTDVQQYNNNHNNSSSSSSIQYEDNGNVLTFLITVF